VLGEAGETQGGQLKGYPRPLGDDSVNAGHAFLNFGGHYPNQIFTGSCQRRMSPVLAELTGKIELYKGRPEILISSPAQIAKE
jgi:hypothetical protein